MLLASVSYSRVAAGFTEEQIAFGATMLSSAAAGRIQDEKNLFVLHGIVILCIRDLVLK